jgi:hypothetical protein
MCKWNKECSWYVCRSAKLLLVLASTVVPGYRSCKDLWPRLLFSPTHVLIEVTPPLRRGESSGLLCVARSVWRTAGLLLALVSTLHSGFRVPRNSWPSCNQSLLLIPWSILEELSHAYVTRLDHFENLLQGSENEEIINSSFVYLLIHNA